MTTVDREAKTVTCSDGKSFPLSSLGMQAADMYEAGLTRVRRPAAFCASVQWRDTTVSLHATAFVISRRYRSPGSMQTWYPLHVAWRRSDRHVHLKRNRPEPRA